MKIISKAMYSVPYNSQHFPFYLRANLFKLFLLLSEHLKIEVFLNPFAHHPTTTHTLPPHTPYMQTSLNENEKGSDSEMTEIINLTTILYTVEAGYPNQ